MVGRRSVYPHNPRPLGVPLPERQPLRRLGSVRAMEQPPLAHHAAHTAAAPAGVPDDMELVQVHVLHRHGDKLPGPKRDLPGYPIEDLRRCRETRRAAGGVCDWDDMTDQGCARMRHLGAVLREALVDRAGLLPPAGPAPGDAFLWYSPFSTRPRDALGCLLRGLWPAVAEPLRQLDVAVWPKEADAPWPIPRPDQCPRLAELDRRWRREHPLEDSDAWRRPALAPLLQAARGTAPGAELRAVVMRLAYSYGHGERPPPGVTADGDFAAASRAIARHYYSGYGGREMAALGVGRFLGKVRRDVRRALSQTPGDAGAAASAGGHARAPKLLLYSAHDDALGPIMAALGAPYASWPAVGSVVMMEVLRGRATGEPFVRVTRDSEVVPRVLGIGGARADGLLPWPKVEARLQELVPADFLVQCQRHE